MSEDKGSYISHAHKSRSTTTKLFEVTMFGKDRWSLADTPRSRNLSTSEESNDGSSAIFARKSVTRESMRRATPRNFDDKPPRCKETSLDYPSDQDQQDFVASTGRHAPEKSREEHWNKRLQQARHFLRDPAPHIGHDFTIRHQTIQDFLRALANENQAFDQDTYDDVQSWLNVRSPETKPAHQRGFQRLGDIPTSCSPCSSDTSSTTESNLESDRDDRRVQFLFGETNHLQKLMSDQIERDLTEDSSDFRAAIPLTRKFALPKAPQSIVEEFQGWFLDYLVRFQISC